MMKSLHVLLVEDSEDDALLILRVLTRAGYEITYQRVETPEGFRAALGTQSWDIVLSDYSMPQFSGSDTMRILLESGLDIPLIIVSGAIGEERAVEIMKAGASDYVMKGNLARLPPALERELREAESRRARKQAESQVQMLSRALEQSASLVMITDPQGVIEYVNQAFTQVTGYSSEELVGVHSRVVKSDTTPPERYEQMWTTILAGDTWRGELQNRKKNGDLFWVETVMSGIKTHDGTITQFLSVQEDITERKRLETELQRYTTQLERMVEERTAELRRAKDQIELILNSTNDALALAQSNGDIQTVNPAFVSTFGDRAAQAIEYILWALANEEQINLVGDALIRVIFDSDSKRVEAQVTTKDGSGKDIDLALIPVRMSDHDPKSGVLVSARDITQLKDIERFKARFVADAVHDLATPIAGLSTRLYLLQRAPEKLSEHVGALQNQVTHLRQLLHDLRTLSNLDKNQLISDLRPLNVNEIVRRVFDTFEPIAVDKEQQITFEPDPALPEISLDAHQFERVIVNLVSNAVNYTPNRKAIHIKTALDGDTIVVEVADQGIGIGPEHLSHIFERFYRAPQARATQETGTGLGLSIVKEIIDQHGGKVSVVSTLGEGSTFAIRLPIQ